MGWHWVLLLLVPGSCDCYSKPLQALEAQWSTLLVQTSLKVDRSAAPQRLEAKSNKSAERPRAAQQRSLVSLLAEVAPLISITLAASGIGSGPLTPDQDQAGQQVLLRLRDQASQQLESAAEGAEVLARKAQLLGSAVVGVVGSLKDLSNGNLTAALQTAGLAVATAVAANAELDAKSRPEVNCWLGILLFSLVLGGGWCVEWALTKYADDKPAEASHAGPSGAEKFAAIGTMQFLCAWMVVLHNYAGEDGTSGFWQNYASWGALAAPCFFVVSGFCHSYSKLAGATAALAEDSLWAMLVRISSWYPLYLLVLILGALRQLTTNAEDWSEFLSNVLLIGGAIWEEPSYPYFLNGWWLSSLMVYLALWSTCHHILNESTQGVLWAIFGSATLLALPVWVVEWELFTSNPLWRVLTYWPSFVYGQTLAFWMVRICMRKVGSVLKLKPDLEMPFMTRYGVTISCVFLGLFTLIWSPDSSVIVIHKPLSALVLKGGLLPILGVMVTGLAARVDPLAKLLARHPLNLVERLALPIFMLQVPVHNWIADLTHWQGITWTFAGSLLAASVIGHYLFDRPWRRIIKFSK